MAKNVTSKRTMLGYKRSETLRAIRAEKYRMYDLDCDALMRELSGARNARQVQNTQARSSRIAR